MRWFTVICRDEFSYVNMAILLFSRLLKSRAKVKILPPYPFIGFPSSRHSLCFTFAKVPQKVQFTRGRSSSAHALHLLAGKVKDVGRLISPQLRTFSITLVSIIHAAYVPRACRSRYGNRSGKLSFTTIKK